MTTKNTLDKLSTIILAANLAAPKIMIMNQFFVEFGSLSTDQRGDLEEIVSDFRILLKILDKESTDECVEGTRKSS